MSSAQVLCTPFCEMSDLVACLFVYEGYLKETPIPGTQGRPRDEDIIPQDVQ